VTAARRVGTTGQVLATDFAVSMVEHAQRRIAPLGLPQIEVRVMDAESPDLPPRSFDAVMCRFGLMFMPSLDRALEALGALLRPGGRLCAAVWSTPDRVPFLWVAQATARRVLGLPPPPTSGQSPFDLADMDTLAARLERAGFRHVEHERVPVVIRFDDAATFVRCVGEMSSSLAALLAARAPAERDAVSAALAEAASAYASERGEVVFENEAFCVVAEGPG
jgi:SAM-dependent methyltransferase